MFLFRKKKHGSEKDHLKNLALLKLEKIKAKKFSEKTFEESAFILRIYLERMFHFRKNSTNEEIMAQLPEKEIKRVVKTRIISLCNKIDEIKYAEKKLTKEEFREFLAEIEKIIRLN